MSKSSAWSLEYAGSAPTHRVITPGRVNIIGEHVDHQLYGVLPCAIAKTIVIDAHEKPIDKQTNDEFALDIRHAQSSDPKFKPSQFKNYKDVKISKEHTWGNYVVTAFMGLVEYYANGEDADKVGFGLSPYEGLTSEIIEKSKKHPNSPLNKCYKLLVDGNVPMEAGLSSSSALTVCSAMAFNTGLKPETLAVLCANAERYSGMAGGGMDQAAAALSEEGMAGHINFAPLSIDKIPLPAEYELVIANTCRGAPKVRDAHKMYNKRVFELKIGCMEIIKKVDPEYAAKITINDILTLGLRDVVRKVLKKTEGEVLLDLPKYIEEKPYTKADAERALGNLREELLVKRCGEKVWTLNEEFYPYERIRHVLSEHLRVNEFVDLCKRHVKKGEKTDAEVLSRLGELLNESQASLGGDFDCSCEEINDITTMARQYGAVGSRLTGAGWGGCTVSLVPVEKVENFVHQLIENYYKPLMKGTKTYGSPLEYLPTDEADLVQVVFATKPAQGARLNKL